MRLPAPLNKEREVLRMIYPADRWVTEKQIRGWYLDAVANGEVEPFNEEPSEFVLDSMYTDMMIEKLQDTGRFTFTES